MRVKFAPLILIGISAAWGLAFVVMKDVIERQDLYSFLATRFVLATLVLILIKPKVLKRIDRDLLLKGVAAGAFLGSGYIMQTLGLLHTSISITGFVTGLYVILTPILGWTLLGHKHGKITWWSAIVATIGLGVLSIHGTSVDVGAIYVFISAILFALHILALGQWSKSLDTYALTIVQLFTCTVIMGVVSAIHGYQAPPDQIAWEVIIFTAVICTSLAFIIQTWAQSILAPTKVAVILTAEVVFAAIFAVLFHNDPFTLRTGIGGALVVGAMYVIVLLEP